MKIDTKFDIDEVVFVKIGKQVLKGKVISIILEKYLGDSEFINPKYFLDISDDSFYEANIHKNTNDLMNREIELLQVAINICNITK